MLQCHLHSPDLLRSLPGDVWYNNIYNIIFVHKVPDISRVKTVEGDDESLYCHGNLIMPLIKRGMMSDYAHVNHASVSVHNGLD